MSLRHTSECGPALKAMREIIAAGQMLPMRDANQLVNRTGGVATSPH